MKRLLVFVFAVVLLGSCKKDVDGNNNSSDTIEVTCRWEICREDVINYAPCNISFSVSVEDFENQDGIDFSKGFYGTVDIGNNFEVSGPLCDLINTPNCDISLCSSNSPIIVDTTFNVEEELLSQISIQSYQDKWFDSGSSTQAGGDVLSDEPYTSTGNNGRLYVMTVIID